MENALLLVVEDDAELNALVTDRLRDEGMRVESVDDGRKALDFIAQKTPTLILLDVMLPGVDGLEVCRQVRASHPMVYIIMLTARGSEFDRVVGLEVGADDYVTKPFSLEELVARVRAALRRLRMVQTQMRQADSSEVETLSFGALRIDPIRREVYRGEELIYLTVKEFDLLAFLAQYPNRPFTRTQLLDKIWDIQYEGYDRTVDSHVQRLRAKVEVDAGNPTYIKTVWGVGYKFHADD